MQREQGRLKAWMRFGQPLEQVLGDFRRVFDAWETAGVLGIVVGRMYFRDDDGRYVPAFRPDGRVYDHFGVRAPEGPRKEFRDRRRQLDRMLEEAKRRKWSVLLFSANAGAGPGGEGHIFADAVSQHAQAARIVDTLGHFPQADGVVLDGPEWGYEIGERSNIFEDLPESVEPLAQGLHYDYRALVAAKDRLYRRLHALDSGSIGLHAPGGFLGAVHLFGSDPDLCAWMELRAVSLTNYFALIRGALRESRGDAKLAVGPRTAAFAPLCGYDFARLIEHVDYLLPKHYFWHRGYDGMYGTVYRWMRTLCQWNAGISEAQALQVVKALFGLALPGVSSAMDFERGFPEAFFTEVVAGETRRALAVAEEPEQIVPWVDVGRLPHDGDPIGAGDFRRILEAAHGAGLRRFVYHNHGHLSQSEFDVMRTVCGDPNRPVPEGYRPPDGLHENVRT